MTVARVVFLAETAAAGADIDKLAAQTEMAGRRMSTAGTEAGTKLGNAVENGSSRAGKGLEGLNSKIKNTFGMGVPGLDKFGQQLESLDTKTQKLGGVMNEVGKTALIGGLAVFAAVGAEAIHMTDALDVAQVSLKTAVTNSGASWQAYNPKLQAAYSSMAKFGWENNNVAGALATLTTATNSPAKALNMLTLASNMAITKNISLADASSMLARILGGSTRVITQWGIPLDLASGKLHSVQQAEMALQNAQLSLNKTQTEINMGQLIGVSASSALAAAQLKLHDANLNLYQSQHAIQTVLTALNQRTRRASEIMGKTLPGQIRIARAELHNLGTSFGEWLVPKVLAAERALMGIFGWLQKNKTIAEVLGGIIATVLSASIAVFAYNRAVAMVTGLQKMGTAAAGLGTKLLGLGATSTEAGATVDVANASVVASSTGMASAVEAHIAQMEADLGGFGAEWAGAAGAMAAAQATMATTTATLADVTATADSAMIAGNEAVGASWLALLGPIGAVVAAAAVAYEILKPKPTSATDTVTANTPQSLLAQSPDASLAMLNQQLPKTKGYVKSEHYVDQHGKAVLTGAPPSTQAQLDAQMKAATGSLTGAGTAGIPKLAKTPGIGAGPSSNLIMTAGDKELVGQVHAFMAGLSNLGRVPTSIIGQAGAIGSLHSALSPAHHAQMQSYAKSLSASGNPTLVAMATTIEGTWASLAAKLASIADSDIKAGQSKIATMQSAISSASLNSLRSDLDSIHKTEMQQLVTGLEAVHTKGAMAMANQVTATWKQATATFNAVIGAKYTTALADEVTKQAAGVAAQTTAAQNAATAQTTIITESSQKMVNAQNAATAQLSATATAQSDATTVQTSIITESSQRITDAMTASATQISDAAKLQSDAAAKQIQMITDQMTASGNVASAQSLGMGDQATLTADILGQRGKYGLDLIAQQAKIALDQRVLIDHQQQAAAQAHLDQVTAADHQLVANAQLRVDQVTSQTNAAEAKAQQAADTQAIVSTQMVAAAQQQVDATTIQTIIQNAAVQQAADTQAIISTTMVAAAQAIADNAAITAAINNAAAQAHVDAAQWGTTLAQQQAEAAMKMAQAQGQSGTTAAQASLQAATATANTLNANAQDAYSQQQAISSAEQAQASARLQAVTDTANILNTNAQTAYSQQQAIAGREQAAATARLQATTNQSNMQIALAQGALASVQNSSKVAEAQLQATYTIDQALAKTEFAGTGTVVNIYGVAANPAAIGDAMDWVARTQVGLTASTAA